MSEDWRTWLGKLTLAIALGSVSVPGGESRVWAQILPDETLGTESSVVTPDTIKGIESDRITGGAIRGSNLYHSFREFNIGEGRGGYFENPTAIANIFSRVTGSNPSEILGTLGVLGKANLFFLNPNGIIFGPNARLDLRGSFLATTADSILFADGNQFSAINPDSPPLLTVNVQPPIGLHFEGHEGLITNAADLAVASRQTLSLSGSDVATTGNLTAPGGRVELLGTESVALLEDATIDVSAPTGGGTVLIGGEFQGQGTVPNAKRTYVGDLVTINADALTNGNGGKVIVWADEVTGFSGRISARGGVESGHGGLVEVSGKEHLIFRGQVDTSAVNGLPGTLLLDPTDITIADGSGDEAGDGTDTLAGNNSGVEGSILTAPLSEIEDTAPTTIYESELEGLSGDTNIILQATNDIRLQDLRDNGLELSAGAGVIAFSADADRDGVGNFVMEDNVADTIFANGRDITISGASLTIGNIDTSVLAVNDAGDLIETALLISDRPGEALESISGNISNTNDVDLFQIYLTGERTFSASTVNPETTFGTPLFLFDADGLGVYANDIDAGCSCLQATLPAGNVLTPTEPGVYYLGIGGFGNEALSSGGAIFPNRFAPPRFIAIKAPTGEGGLLPLSGWAGGLEEGSYRIDLTGVEATESTVVESMVQPRGDSGSITLKATNGNITAGNLNTTSPLSNAGAVSLNAKGNITINGRIQTSASTGNGGDVNLTAGGNVLLTPFSSILSNGLLAGNVTLNSQGDITLERGGITSTNFTGNESNGLGGGDITLAANSIFIKNATFLNANAEGQADSGLIKLIASDRISITGQNIAGVGSNILTQVNTGASGDSKGIIIETNNLFLSDGTSISASTLGKGNAGAIAITATDAITLEGENSQGSGSGIFSSVASQAEGTAGEISIDTGSLFLKDGAQISSSTFGVGDAGAIRITAPDAISLEGESRRGIVSGIFSAVASGGKGTAREITIETGSLSLRNGAAISAETRGLGDGGIITVDARQAVLLTDNSKLTVETSSAGKPGDILIATPHLTIGKDAEISATATSTSTNTEGGGSITVNASNLDLTGKLGIFAETKGEAPAGTLKIQPDNNQPNLDIQFTNTAIISASTTASGTGGDINLTAPATINISGQGQVAVETTGTGTAGRINITTEDLNISNQTEISASTSSSGQAGNINITAEHFNLREGATVITNTASSGQAGDIQLQIRDNLNLVNSTIAASTDPNSTGKGGNINIDPQTVTLTNSQIAVNSQGEGTGGNITLQAEALTLVEQSAISAETFSTDGGNIEMALGENLILRDNSQITATAGTAQAGGDGGNINIDTPFIIAFPNEDSNIAANAFEGKGGNVIINANGIFGIEEGDEETPLSDITASSEFGQQGEVEINTAAIDPTRGLNNLPQEAVEAELAQGCQAEGGQPTLAFFDVGRGGLPPSPDDLLSSEIVISEWIPLDLAEKQTLDEIVSESQLTTTTPLQLSCPSR